MKCVRLALAVVVILVAGAEARAEDATDAREAIERRSRGGDRLTIDTRQGPTLEGRLVSSGADALVLDMRGREQSVPFGDIDRARRRRNGVVVGAVVGLAAGLTFGIPARMLINNENGDGNSMLLTLVGTGVITGLLVDGLLSVNRTIYRRSAGSVRFGVEPQIGGATIRVTARW
jgi:hypothetical protein